MLYVRKDENRFVGGLAKRLTILFICSTLLSAITLGALGFYSEWKAVNDGFDEKLTAIASIAALQIDGDAFATIKEPKDSETLHYKEMAATLQAIMLDQNLTYAYSVILQDGLPTLIVDGSIEPEEIGTRYEPSPELNRLYENGRPSVTGITVEGDYGRLKTAYAPIRNSSGELVGAVAVDMSAEQIHQHFWHDVRTFAIAWFVVMIVGVIFAISAARSIASPIRKVATMASRLAEGDLTVGQVDVYRRDEIGEVAYAFNSLVTNFRSVIARVTEDTAAVSTAAEELLAAAKNSADGAQEAVRFVGQVATGANDQAIAANRVREAMGQLQETVARMADGAMKTAAETQKSVNLLFKTASDIGTVTKGILQVEAEADSIAKEAGIGADIMEQTVISMESVHRSTLASVERMQALQDQVGHVDAIIGLISDIADQTNLLALNAAIEAARAGEAGRGFAVVAEEVRKLAEQSNQSTAEIAAILQEIRERSDSVAAAMAESITRTEQGSELARDARKALQGILHDATNSVAVMGQMANVARAVQSNTETVVQSFESVAAVTEANTRATEEIAAGSDLVGQSVTRIAAVSREHASASERMSSIMNEVNNSAGEVTHAAQHLARIAADLQTQVARFRL